MAPSLGVTYDPRRPDPAGGGHRGFTDEELDAVRNRARDALQDGPNRFRRLETDKPNASDHSAPPTPDAGPTGPEQSEPDRSTDDPPWDTTPVNPDLPWFPSQNPARLLWWSEWETWTGPERAAAPAWAMAADLGVWAEFGWTALDPWFRDALERNGFGAPAWAAIRRAAWLAKSGVPYVTPDAIEALPDEALEPLTEADAVEAGPESPRPDGPTVPKATTKTAKTVRRDLASAVPPAALGRRRAADEGPGTGRAAERHAAPTLRRAAVGRNRQLLP